MTRRDIGNGGNICFLGLDSPGLGAAVDEMEGGKAPIKTPPAGGRPALTSHQSNSLPSTPYQRPRNRTSDSRSPSLGPSALNASPRSSHSDSNNSLPPLRRIAGGCKYETGMAKARRRVPYSLGPDKLEAESQSLKMHLDPEEARKLSGDMRELYDRLQPSPDSEERRGRLMNKLEKLLNDRWPGHDIQVHVFGSSGNMLGTTDSDVDICLTTDWAELEQVCRLAELLANSGMERVVCVSSAKVPIVKYWDPELQLACDMNVNNTVALENTELIRAYVSLDDRIRPLAMIIKHWTRRRILNDAALGGTLSSYTWICMIINFLQTCDPPILPALQQARGLQPRMLGGFNVAFDKDLKSYSGFGVKNQNSLGELLFQFFRYYGHELDFEENVMSVRLGRTLPKRQKGWHQMQDNRLCVEEPFNISRNLGNTADDTSMRGIHLELRRAFSLVSKGKLDVCCEAYEPPRDEGRTSDIFKPPVSRPVVTQAPAQSTKGVKTNTRGARHGSQFNRGPNTSGRRPSNPANRGGSAYLRSLPFQMTPQELQLQQQHQQHLLHDRLFQQYQYLQAQEQELRLQLHQQALLNGRSIPSTMSYPHIAFPSYTAQEDSYDDETSSRASSVSRASMSAPLHQQRFGYTSPYLSSIIPAQGINTNPPSPHLNSAIPLSRRYPRRGSVTQSSGGPLRAHSQPPRSVAVPASLAQPQPHPDASDLQGQASSAPFSSDLRQSRTASTTTSSSFLQQPHRPAEYIGYYVGQSPSLAACPRSAGISPIPAHVGLAIQNGGLSPRSFSQTPRSPFSSVVPSTETPPLSTAASTSVRGRKPRAKSSIQDKGRGTPAVESNLPPEVPSAPANLATQQNLRGVQDSHEPVEALTFSATTSEDLTFDTPSSSDTQSQAGPESATAEFEPSFQAVGSDKVTAAESSDHRRIMENMSISNPASDQMDLEQTAQFVPSRRDAERCEGGAVQVNGHTQNQHLAQSPLDLKLAALRLGEQLSPVTEIRTPSPSRDLNEGGQKTAKTKESRPNSKSKVDKLKLPGSQVAPTESMALSSKPNGQIQTTSSGSSVKALPQVNGWQTQKKKKKPKKAVKSENDADQLNMSGGDAIPVDDALRKGG